MVRRNTSGSRGTPWTKVLGFYVGPLSFKWLVAPKSLKIVFCFIQNNQSTDILTFLILLNVIVLGQNPWKHVFLSKIFRWKKFVKKFTKSWKLKKSILMLLVISHEPVELQKRALPFPKVFFIINNFVNRQKALKPFFITVIAKNISSLFFTPVSS